MKRPKVTWVEVAALLVLAYVFGQGICGPGGCLKKPSPAPVTQPFPGGPARHA